MPWPTGGDASMPWSTARKDPAYGRAAWRRARLACLRNANWRCEIRLEGICIGAATQADHINRLANDPGHQALRAACAPCHRRVTAGQGNAAQRRSNPAVETRTTW